MAYGGNVAIEQLTGWQGVQAMAVRYDEKRKKWVVDFVYVHPDGRKEPRYRKDFAGKLPRDHDKALAIVAKHEEKVLEAFRNGTYGKREIPTYREYAKEVLDFMRANREQWKTSYVHNLTTVNRLHLEPYFGAMRLDAITTDTVERFKAEVCLRKGDTGARVDGVYLCGLLDTLTLVMREAWNADLIRTPVLTRRGKRDDAKGKLAIFKPKLAQRKKVSKVTEDMFHTAADAAKLVASSDGWVRNLITLALHTGLRIGELRALHWDDVNWKAKKLTVRRNLTDGVKLPKAASVDDWVKAEELPKGNSENVLDLNTNALAALRSQFHMRSVYVFCDDAGKPLSRNAATKPVYRACVAAGLKGKGPHALRHTFVSMLVMSGVTLGKVRELARHTDIKVTMRYAHMEPAQKVRAMDVLCDVYGNGLETQASS